MKMIHCADLHLDSRMEANLTKEQARERRQELLGTFTRMVAYAGEEGVRAILIAGDLFDGAGVSRTALHVVKDEIVRHPGIDFLYLRGNHDPEDFLRSFEGQLPENLKLFSDTWTFWDYGEAVVGGVELTRENQKRIYDILRLAKDRINIVTLHGQEADHGSGDGIIPIGKLQNRGIDYLALGHVHSYRLEKLDDRGMWCYSGCLEGRGFDECGQKGFVLLDIKAGRVKTQFIPFGIRQCTEISVDVSGLDTSPRMLEAVRRAAVQIPASSLVKVALTGEIPVDAEKNTAYLLQWLRENFYFAKLYDKTRLAVPYDSYRYDCSLKGEFVRLVSGQELAEEEKEKIIRMGIRALAGEEPEE
ncbi:MAG TPA: DNA repair exonuclease [Lachnospiraceae bacterium]|nr:DNA repair exonuclease [Lachnospiraceae bacterium]